MIVLFPFRKYNYVHKKQCLEMNNCLDSCLKIILCDNRQFYQFAFR